MTEPIKIGIVGLGKMGGIRAKTIREVYRSLVALHDQTAPVPVTSTPQTVVANNGDLPVPSRYGPSLPMDFTQLYSTDPNNSASPVAQTQDASAARFVVVDPGAAFFAQLYNR